MLDLVSGKEPESWDAFVASQGGHVLQSFAWGQLKAEFGWQVRRLALHQDGTRVSAAQILLRRGSGLTLAYVPRGPVWDPECPAALSRIIQAILNLARDEGAFLLKVEPNATSSGPMTEALRAAGLAPSGDTVQPRTTIHLDLSSSLDDLLAGMKAKWRYNIRLAARKGITVRAGQPVEFARIYDLMRLTGERDGFAVHSAEYYRRATELLGERDMAQWLVATYDDEILAAIFLTAWGPEAIYLYGASGNAHRERMPNHALHWAAIQWAKTRGCLRYDLWGVPVANGETGENGAPRADEKLPEGLYRFKQGFGGRMVQYAGTWDLVLSPVRYRLYTGLRRIRQPAT